MDIQIKSPAKLNLSLTVYAPRHDGYHPIASCFQKINLWDSISIRQTKQPGLALTCNDPSIPTDHTNTLAACYAKIKDRLLHGLSVHLNKKMPVGSGLGSASGNAAAFLKTINRVCTLGYTNHELMQLGRSIGSDVPVFIHECSTAWVTQTGESVTPIGPCEFNFFLLVFPNQRMSTQDIYAAYDAIGHYPDEPLTQATPDYGTLGHNDLQHIVWQLYPLYQILQDAWIRKHPESRLHLTGSGGCLFVPALDAATVDHYYSSAKELWPSFWIKTVSTPSPNAKTDFFDSDSNVSQSFF
ncbi:MAG: 4-(cytidine 5'-diphospho)-2-C-methyl-D-erythritol kinase [bacterium]|nr:4-(cytidine 5'-diphospho)-2-C-methyl-D-erythritol kinase [bacterium]